jgi:hypothetical protein
MSLRATDTKLHFGFDIHFRDEDANAFVRDGTGDRLDAFLCAIQAGWAYSKRAQNFGISGDCDPLEGWIVDPLLLTRERLPWTAAGAIWRS